MFHRRSFFQGLFTALGLTSLLGLAKRRIGRPASVQEAEQRSGDWCRTAHQAHPLYLDGARAISLPQAELGDHCVCAVWKGHPALNQPTVDEAQTLMEAAILPEAWRWSAFENLRPDDFVVLVHRSGPEKRLVVSSFEDWDALPQVWRVTCTDINIGSGKLSSFRGENVPLKI